ncbi:Lipocalin-like domain [Nesidiocoris tenuis]|uniref:Lipocalin-like domain n=1 Tax=Nesidiocoris tenuis TaxID=355587 RepID=A0ABN7AN56_9HEMI|nr:Lipocalin-like domain [Nesidiocoris tenuis]
MWARSAIVTMSMVVLVRAQIPSLGNCPSYSPMQDFNMSLYMGRWYEAERYFNIYQIGGVCVTLDYVKDENNSTKAVRRQQSALTGSISESDGKVSDVRNSPQSTFFMRYSYLPMEIPYTILGTDYGNYSVAWSCNSFGIATTTNAWILTRERHPSLETMQKAYAVFDKFNISKAYLMRTNEWNCLEDKKHLNST